MAKNDVLDILGYGVPSEYLVDIGLSPQTIFYVFSELNLRLPSNLGPVDLNMPSHSQIQPLTSPAASRSAGPSRLSNNQPQSIPSAFPTHPSLPRKPSLAAQDAAFPSSAKSTSATLPAPTNLAPSGSKISLEDLEKQRRQLILARKAVQASRKNKDTPAPNSTAPPVENADVDMQSIVPEEAVDNFLNSIPASVDGTVALPAMLVDELDTTKDNSVSIPPKAMNDSPLSDFEDDFHSLSPPPLPSTMPPPTTTSSVATTNSTATILMPRPSLPPRRGMKRPTATDFVDLDPGPSTRSSLVDSAVNPPLKHKTSSFANVSAMRRCVIDLSDSDDEVGAVDATVVVSHRGTPITSTPSPYPNATPSALLETELAIKQMREAIAKREAKRMKKQGSLVSFLQGNLSTTSRPNAR